MAVSEDIKKYLMDNSGGCLDDLRYIASLYSISDFFIDKYYYENYSQMSKYQSLILSNTINTANIVLFENDLDEIERAIKFGINKNQIIRIRI